MRFHNKRILVYDDFVRVMHPKTLKKQKSNNKIYQVIEKVIVKVNYR